jgi:hypothetical protein
VTSVVVKMSRPLAIVVLFVAVGIVAVSVAAWIISSLPQ